MRKFSPIALLTALFLLSAPVSATELGPGNNSTMQNVPAMRVVVKEFGPDPKNAGFRARTFQTDVELKLRLAGIRVLDEAGRLKAPGQPYIYLNVTPIHDRRGDAASYGIDLEFRQSVPLSRDPSVTVDASTWSIGLVGYGRLPNVRAHVRDMMDTFINAWLAVNQ